MSTPKQYLTQAQRDTILKISNLSKKEVLGKVGFTITTDDKAPGTVTWGLLDEEDKEYKPDPESSNAWLLENIGGKVFAAYRYDVLTEQTLFKMASNVIDRMRDIYYLHRFSGVVIIQHCSYNDHGAKVTTQVSRITM